MPRNTLIYEKREQTIRLIFNRPTAGNNLNLEFAKELVDACSEINEDESVRAVIITGAGNAFCTGIDLDELLTLTSGEVRRSNPANLASGAVASINCPSIAAINGDALGAGLELALACDIRIASENASFGFPETSYGLIPGGGGTQRLPRIIGRGKATEMILTARIIDAEEAYQVGLISRVVSADRLIEEAAAIAERLVSRAPIAVRYAKEAVYKGIDMTLDQGLRLEADLSFLLQTTADRDEGIKAFLKKRKPQFKGE
ncbi:MAG: enoyl-CoA hydratase/isomerase family protein [Dehalococcoidia bacterium]|nr:MAG: enoyl-CoA hydratase/isomerase family protein [Dehalococcoidia bacterium]